MTATQLNATPDSMEETFVTGNRVQLIEGSSEKSSCLPPPYQRRAERKPPKRARHSRADRGGMQLSNHSDPCQFGALVI